MSGTRNLTRIVRVRVEERHPGLFFAVSGDLRGLFMAKESLQGALAEIPLTIEALYAAGGEDVIVEALDGEEDGRAWVAVPVVAAEAALARHRRPMG